MEVTRPADGRSNDDDERTISDPTQVAVDRDQMMIMRGSIRRKWLDPKGAVIKIENDQTRNGQSK